MNNSWFDKGFDGVEMNDGFFDDIIEYLDFPLEDVEETDKCGASSGEGVVKDFPLPPDGVDDKNGVGIGGVDVDGGEEWDCNFENLEPPPANVLASLSSGFCSDILSDTLVNNLTVSCDESSQLNQWSSTTKASSSRSTTLNGDSADVKGSTWFQSSSPVSVLESSSSCSAAKATAINPKPSFLVKRYRSKRRRASTFNLRFTLPFISSASSTSTGSTSLVGSESESESNLAKKSTKKNQKKKNLTWLSSSSEINKSLSQQPVVVRKCTHCEITKTPQWREGPNGPKTLCNACGVRYRSGRLFPEYRPAASPTFVPSLHSNSHKKVVEMRRKGQASDVCNTINGICSTGNVI